jgi:hypothetical protein
MTSNEKIVMFMEEKNNLIKSYNKELDYFNDGDKEEILLKWSEESADKVWKQLKKEKNETGLNSSNCPFCIYNPYYYGNSDVIIGMDCDTCGYKKRHKKCSKTNSTFNKIVSFFYTHKIDMDNIFSKKFYNELIKRIEKE